MTGAMMNARAEGTSTRHKVRSGLDHRRVLSALVLAVCFIKIIPVVVFIAQLGILAVAFAVGYFKTLDEHI